MDLEPVKVKKSEVLLNGLTRYEIEVDPQLGDGKFLLVNPQGFEITGVTRITDYIEINGGIPTDVFVRVIRAPAKRFEDGEVIANVVLLD